MDNLTTLFECKINTSNAEVPLGLKILLDNKEIYNNSHIDGKIEFKYPIAEDESEHELQFVMFGKKPEHTRVDDQGNITQDALLSITDICLDEIEISNIMKDLAVYRHSFNGTQAETEQKFYGEIGCNGTITFSFSMPIYLWLLENM